MNTYVPKAGSIVAAVVTLSISSFALAACGGSGDGLDADQQALADAIAQDSDVQELLDATQSQCFGETVVKDLGVDRLEELGITVDSPSGFGDSDKPAPTDAEVDKVVDAYDQCAGIKKLLTLTLEQTMDPDAASCTVDKLSNDDLREVVKTGLLETQPSAELTQKVASAMQECGAA